MASVSELRWIWHPDDGQTEETKRPERSAEGHWITGRQPSYFFIRNLLLDNAPDKAWLQFYSGCGYRFFVNGIQLGPDWYSGHATYCHDMKPHLRQGSNTLAIEVYRGHVHPGLMAIGEIETAGSKQILATNPSEDWLTSTTMPEGWPTPDDSELTEFLASASLTDILDKDPDDEMRDLGKALSTFDPNDFDRRIQKHYQCVSLESITVGGERTAICREAGFFPVLQKLPDGRIVAVVRREPHLSIYGNLAVAFSNDNGLNWSDLQTAAQGTGDHRNPAMGLTAHGRILIAMVRIHAYDAEGNWTPAVSSAPSEPLLVHSDDSGKTWTSPQPMQAPDWLDGSPHGQMVTLPDGSILMSVYGSFSGEPRKETCSGVLRSNDNGESWELLSVLAEGFNETSLCLLPSGRLFAMLRAETRKANLWHAVSSDGGKTWSSPIELTDDQQHPGNVILLPTGELLLTYGHRQFPYGVQCRLSRDEGATWLSPKRFILSADAITEDCGYPSSIVTEDGHILTTYYSIGTRLDPTLGVHAMAVHYTVDDLEG
jgi:hypothetical protein